MLSNLMQFPQSAISYFLIWYLFCAIFAYFMITFITQNHAISCISSSPLLKRYTGNSIPSAFDIAVFTKYIKFLPTSCTPRGRATTCTLSIQGLKLDRYSEPHNSSPHFTWRKGRIEDYFYDADGKWTGIHIVKVRDLWVSRRKAISLKHPNFRISFIPNLDFSEACELVESPTLLDAKEIAERYYKEWIKANKTH